MIQQNNVNFRLEKSPILPRYLSTTFSFIPSKVHTNMLVQFLNKLLMEQMREGDLDFLMDKCLCININDAKIKFYISLIKTNDINRKLISMPFNKNNDIEITASTYDFLQLAARQQDPDALMFQRRLIIQGSTELGLEIKNFLDGLDLESSVVFSKIELILKKSLPLFRRLFN